MSQQPSQVDSILAIDIGSVSTQAVLVAHVEGAFRFVARAQSPTTLEEPWSDVAVGVRHTIEQLARIAARPMLNNAGDVITPEQSNGSGVDVCVITCSAAQPLRLVLAGLVNDLDVDSMRRAVAGTYTWVEDAMALLGIERLSDEARARRIMALQPDAVCIAGGTDGGAEDSVLDLVEAITLGAALLDPELRPKIVFAGNANLRPAVRELIGTQAELLMAESNVRPNLETENLGPLETELEVLHANTKIARVPGLATCAAWSNFPVLSTARSFGHVVQYISVSGDAKRGALGVDVGASTTTLAAAFNGQLQLAVRSDIGTAFGGARLLSEVGVDSIARWLPFELSEGELEAFVINKEIHPVSIPSDTRDLLIEQALAREAIRSALHVSRPSWPVLDGRSAAEMLPPLEPIIGSGAVLTRAPRPGQAALMLLDALEPIGLTTLLLDVYGLMPAMGIAAIAQPLCAVQAIENDGLFPLGTVVVPVGRARAGEVILGVKISYENGGDLEIEVAAGTLEVLPLTKGQKATLRLQPRRNIDIGRGPGRGGRPIEVNGGAVGLIIDARGRPLSLPSDAERRRARVQQWLWDVGA
jgi:hypothetical protein